MNLEVCSKYLYIVSKFWPLSARIFTIFSLRVECTRKGAWVAALLGILLVDQNYIKKNQLSMYSIVYKWHSKEWNSQNDLLSYLYEMFFHPHQRVHFQKTMFTRFTHLSITTLKTIA